MPADNRPDNNNLLEAQALIREAFDWLDGMLAEMNSTDGEVIEPEQVEAWICSWLDRAGTWTIETTEEKI